VGPADTTKGIAGEGKEQNADDPDRMYKPEGADLSEGDAFEGVPKEKGADGQSRNGLEEIAGAGCDHATTASRMEIVRKARELGGAGKSITSIIVSL